MPKIPECGFCGGPLPCLTHTQFPKLPKPMDVLPLSVGFAVEYIDGVMKAERHEIQQHWKSVREFLMARAQNAALSAEGGKPCDTARATSPSEDDLADFLAENGMLSIGVDDEWEMARAILAEYEVFNRSPKAEPTGSDEPDPICANCDSFRDHVCFNRKSVWNGRATDLKGCEQFFPDSTRWPDADHG